MQTFASTANAKNSGVKYETLWISGTVHDLMQVAMKNECNYLKKSLHSTGTGTIFFPSNQNIIEKIIQIFSVKSQVLEQMH